MESKPKTTVIIETKTLILLRVDGKLILTDQKTAKSTCIENIIRWENLLGISDVEIIEALVSKLEELETRLSKYEPRCRCGYAKNYGQRCPYCGDILEDKR